jgi:hypothetical protein
MKFPIYELTIDENENAETAVNFVALVDAPAIQKNFLAFKSEEGFVHPAPGEEKTEFMTRCVPLVRREGRDIDQAVAICDHYWQASNEQSAEIKFSVVNEEQRIITGPLMLADELIYRNNEKFGEHYVKFSAETIKKIAIKFAKKKYQTNVNLMHDGDQQVDGVTMFESWLVDKTRGVKPMGNFEEVPDGSWFGSFYVENDAVWAKIKEGGLRGYSVEGIFEYEDPISAEENALKKIGQLLNELYED